MYKERILINLMLLITLAVAPSVFAQSADDNGEQNTAGLSPTMPDLFFRQAQRRVLEAVRHGLVDRGYFDDVKKLAPVILVQRQVEEIIVEEEEAPLRSGALEINAMIYNRAKGSSHVWVNNQLIDLQDQFVLASEGVRIKDSDGDSSYISGSDVLSQSEFKVKVGQIIGVDGRIEESLPIVKVRGK